MHYGYSYNCMNTQIEMYVCAIKITLVSIRIIVSISKYKYSYNYTFQNFFVNI